MPNMVEYLANITKYHTYFFAVFLSLTKNTESPIIYYKYNKPIRNTILNFNKFVSDLDIETSSPDS